MVDRNIAVSCIRFGRGVKYRYVPCAGNGVDGLVRAVLVVYNGASVRCC